MDSSSIIIGIILLVLFILPFILLQIGSYRKKKLFNQVCQNNAFVISEREDMRLCTLALDRSQKAFLFYNQQGKTARAEVVQLNEVMRCDILGENPKINSDEPIGLQMEFKGVGEKTRDFFLTEKNDGIATQEEAYQIARRWQSKINGQLK